MDENLDLSKNVELKEALEKFNTDNANQVAEKPIDTDSVATSKLVQFLMDHSGGFIKDQKLANYILFSMVVVIFLIQFFIIFNNDSGSSSSPEPDPDSLIFINNPNTASLT